jgi:carboxyl-terminal processing protease
MNRTKLFAGGFLAALFFAFGIGLFVGVSERIDRTALAATFTIPGTSISLFGGASQPSDVDLNKLWLAWNLLEQNFVQTHGSSTLPTDVEKVYGAISGLADSYGDQYTVFMPPTEAKQFNDDIKGEFGGVGMELGERNGSLTVVAPLKGSPAETAGIRAGDIVLAVNEKATEQMAVDAAVKLIRGEVGTKVTLILKRAGTQEPLTITVTRQIIKIPVINAYARQDGIFVIELYSFSENSVDLFRGALRQYFESGSTKLILDLRGNPGGYLEAAVQMSSYFLPAGETVVSENYGGKAADRVHRSLGYNVFQNKKLSMAILVDQGSASASEILAGALNQHGVAKLIGTRTFGKGSVQQLLQLGDGAQLKVTIAKWVTPNGSSISDGGLKPDIEVERTAEQYKEGKDPQKDAAISWLITQ